MKNIVILLLLEFIIESTESGQNFTNDNTKIANFETTHQKLNGLGKRACSKKEIRRFVFFEKKGTYWEGCKVLCKTKNMKLANIQSDEEGDTLLDQVQRETVKDGFYYLGYKKLSGGGPFVYYANTREELPQKFQSKFSQSASHEKLAVFKTKVSFLVGLTIPAAGCICLSLSTIDICSKTVDGGWSGWMPIGICDAACTKNSKTSTARGRQTYQRFCLNPPPSGGGKPCKGNFNEKHVSCQTDCVVHGDWGPWQDVNKCSQTCGRGLVRQVRHCNNPTPVNGGHRCGGQYKRLTYCLLPECRQRGMWSNWVNVTTCSVTCGVGVIARERKCNNPAPLNGNNCPGKPVVKVPCTRDECPKKRQWTEWFNWHPCSKTCGFTGFKERMRKCQGPKDAKYHEGICHGEGFQRRRCILESCNPKKNGTDNIDYNSKLNGTNIKEKPSKAGGGFFFSGSYFVYLLIFLVLVAAFGGFVACIGFARKRKLLYLSDSSSSSSSSSDDDDDDGKNKQKKEMNSIP